MIMKSLFLVLVGSALVLSNPAPQLTGLSKLTAPLKNILKDDLQKLGVSISVPDVPQEIKDKVASIKSDGVSKWNEIKGEWETIIDEGMQKELSEDEDLTDEDAVVDMESRWKKLLRKGLETIDDIKKVNKSSFMYLNDVITSVKDSLGKKTKKNAGHLIDFVKNRFKGVKVLGKKMRKNLTNVSEKFFGKKGSKKA